MVPPNTIQWYVGRRSEGPGEERAAPRCHGITSGARRHPGASERRPTGRFLRSLGALETLADVTTSPSRPLLPRKRGKRSYEPLNGVGGH